MADLSEAFRQAIERMKQVRIQAKIKPTDPFGFVLDAQQEFGRIAVESMTQTGVDIAASNERMVTAADRLVLALNEFGVRVDYNRRICVMMAAVSFLLGVGLTLALRHVSGVIFPEPANLVVATPRTLCNGRTFIENGHHICRFAFDLDDHGH